jgi:hypothetical protein
VGIQDEGRRSVERSVTSKDVGADPSPMTGSAKCHLPVLVPNLSDDIFIDYGS